MLANKKKVIAVIGATGNQGGAVLRALPAPPPLNDGALDVVSVVTDPGTVVAPPRDAATALGTAALWQTAQNSGVL